MLHLHKNFLLQRFSFSEQKYFSSEFPQKILQFSKRLMLLINNKKLSKKMIQKYYHNVIINLFFIEMLSKKNF